MAITLSRLYADSQRKQNIELIAGREGLKSLVRWVHMIEDSEVPGFLHGNELVFTTGIAHRGTGWLLDFVKNLRLYGAIGLVVNLGPYIASVPENVIVFCDENSFPLFTIPWEMHLIDVTFDYCHRIIANEERETTIAAAFRGLIFSPENAQAYAHILERHGFNDRGGYALMLIKAPGVGGDDWHGLLFRLQNRLNDAERSFCLFVQQNALVVVGAGVGRGEMGKYAQALKDELESLGRGTAVHIGISDEATGYKEIPVCYREALIASNAARAMKRGVLRYADAGMYRIICAVEDTATLRKYAEDRLGKIEAYDRAHSTDYLTTLKYYLENNGSIQKVSRLMRVHRNTVNYKMKLIRENFGVGCDSKDIADLWTAFHIREIIDL